MFRTKVVSDVPDIEWPGWEERGAEHGGEGFVLLVVMEWIGFVDHRRSAQLQSSQQSPVPVSSTALPTLEDLLWNRRCSDILYILVFCILSEIQCR